MFVRGWDNTKCPLKRGVRLWEVKNPVLVCGWDHYYVTAYGEVSVYEGSTVVALVDTTSS